MSEAEAGCCGLRRRNHVSSTEERLLDPQLVIKESRGWLNGLAGILGAGSVDERTRCAAIHELSVCDEDSRASFFASMEAKASLPGGLNETRVQEAIEELRQFQQKADEALSPLRKWLRKTLSDFKAFITKGQVVDLAVASVMALAFKDMVQGFTTAFLTPSIALSTKYANGTYDGLSFEVDGVTFPYGVFLGAVIDFFIVAAFLYFFVVKPYALLTKTAENTKLFHQIQEVLGFSESEKKDAAVKKKTTKECPECCSDIPVRAKKCKFCASPVSSGQTDGIKEFGPTQ